MLHISRLCPCVVMFNLRPRRMSNCNYGQKLRNHRYFYSYQSTDCNILINYIYTNSSSSNKIIRQKKYLSEADDGIDSFVHACNRVPTRIA